MTNRSEAVDVAPQALFLAALLLLGTALLVGGRAGALNGLVVELAALPALYILLTSPRSPLPIAAKVFALVLGLGLLQLVPLPPAIWQSLAGREPAIEALRAVGITPGWRPLALDPFATTMALCALLPPFLLYLLTHRLERPNQLVLLRLIAGFALASALLGVLQRVTGHFTPYDTEHVGTSTGLMINRNHHADLIIIGMLLLPGLFPAEQRRRMSLPLSIVAAGMAMTVVATTSRMGMLIALPAFAAALAMIWQVRGRWVFAPLLAVIACAVIVTQLPAFDQIFARFAGSTGDERVIVANNTLVAIRAFWPWGAGYGSFVPVYAAFEDLDYLHSRYVVAAHNDYLQIALEGGLLGVISIAAALALFCHLAWKLYSSRVPPAEWAPWLGGCVLLVHSVSDYPLHMPTLTAIFAVCFGAAEGSLRAIAKPGNPT